MPNPEQTAITSATSCTRPSPVLVVAYGDEYHRSAAAALYAYAQVVADIPIGDPGSVWGAANPDARSVGKVDAAAWDKVTAALDASDKSALDAAMAAIIADTAVQVLGVAEMRSEVVMILRGYASSHELARDTCLHDHYHRFGEPCPRSAT